MPRHVLTREDSIKGGKSSRRGPSLVNELKKQLEESPEIVGDLMSALIKHAKEGSPAHMKMALEYLDGKVPDKVELDAKLETTEKVLDLQAAVEREQEEVELKVKAATKAKRTKKRASKMGITKKG